ncbi:MAG: InlB B-repeat-containing protein, partial [Bifidobacteriaceae bacterium]|nr:InlB B-repeat-containing protein [Bifidobacteriaceae bacterium]
MTATHRNARTPFVAAFLAVALVASMFNYVPLQAADVTIQCGSSGDQITYIGNAGSAECSDENVLTLQDGAIGTIQGETTSARIEVQAGATVNITLENANLTSSNNSPFTLNENANATIKLQGENRLTSAEANNQFAALNAPNTSTLTLTSASGDKSAEGILKAKTDLTNSTSGAAIGGNHSQQAGNININGGTLIALTQENSTAIGSNGDKNEDNISISGGLVYAIGGGIGANQENATPVTIQGTPIILAPYINGYGEGATEPPEGVLIADAVSLTEKDDKTIVTIKGNFTIPSGATFYVPENVEIIPANNSTIQINGEVEGKINGAAVADTEVTEFTKTSISIKKPELLANVDQEIEYAISDKNALPENANEWTKLDSSDQDVLIPVDKDPESTPYYIFTRSAENSNYKQGEAKTLKASIFTVTFNSNGGSNVKAKTVLAGGKITKPSNPVKANNLFAGWYTDEALTNAWNVASAITSDMILYADWTLIEDEEEANANADTTTLIFSGNADYPTCPATLDGYAYCPSTTPVIDVPSIQVSVGSSGKQINVVPITVNQCYRDGYTLLGFYDSPEGDTIYWNPNGTVAKARMTSPGGTLTFYAHWEPITYKVKYDVGVGNASKPADGTATFDRNYTVANYTGTAPNGSRFLYWALNGEKVLPGSSLVNKTTTDGAEITLTARYEDMLKVANENDFLDLIATPGGDPVQRKDIASITFKNTTLTVTDCTSSNAIPAPIQKVGVNFDNLQDVDGDAAYGCIINGNEVIVGQKGGVRVNPNSSYLFSHLWHININNLSSNTSNWDKVTNMSYMFAYSYNDTSANNLGGGRNEVIPQFPAGFGSQATDMSYMFYNVGSLVAYQQTNWGSITITNFPAGFGSVATNMKGMFQNFAASPTGIANGNSSTNNTLAVTIPDFPANFGAAATNMSDMFNGFNRNNKIVNRNAITRNITWNETQFQNYNALDDTTTISLTDMFTNAWMDAALLLPGIASSTNGCATSTIHTDMYKLLRVHTGNSAFNYNNNWVCYNANGGTPAPQPVQVPYNTATSQPTSPEKTGFALIAWYTSQDFTTQYNFTSSVTQNITLFASWGYYVTFDTTGGSAVPQQSIVPNGKVARPANPTRSDYVFLDWYKDSSLKQLWNFETDEITAATTIYASWRQRARYFVAFDTDGGSAAPATQTIVENTPAGRATRPANPTRDAYVFNGWLTPAGNIFDFNTPITGDVVLKASWTANSATKYAVSFTVDSGMSASTFITQNVIQDRIAINPGSPVPNAPATYQFAGWKVQGETDYYNFASPVTSALVLVASFTQLNQQGVTYRTVTFNTGTEDPPSFTVTVPDNTKIQRPPDPYRKGYTLKQWTQTGLGQFVFDFDHAITADTTIYAAWTFLTGDTYTVTFDSNGGTPRFPQTVAKGNKVVKPMDPAKQGYTIEGWYKEANFQTEWNFLNDTVIGNTTLYAKWVQGQLLSCGDAGDQITYFGAYDSATCVSNVLTVTANTTATISGTTSSARVVVLTGITATITLSDASITSATSQPFALQGNANVELLLAGINSLTTSANGLAALNVPNTATLTIQSSTGDENGTLNASSNSTINSNSGAGIGGNSAQAAGSITIAGGTVNAKGGGPAFNAASGNAAAGIGGGYNAAGGNITITGGNVTATPGRLGAGIGGGGNGASGTINISGGYVRAYPGEGGSAIGAGYGAAAQSITISGGTVIAATALGQRDDQSYGAAIGAGGNNQSAGTINITGGAIIASKAASTAIGGSGNNSVGTVNISGGTIYALGRGIGVNQGTARTATNIQGKPIILATAVNGKTASDAANGILIGNNDVTLASDTTVDITRATIKTLFTVPAGATFTIPTDGLEVIPDADYSITINGNLAGKINGAQVTDIGLTEITPNSATIDATQILANTLQDIEYTISTSDLPPSTGWITQPATPSVTIPDITPLSTRYYIYTRSRETSTYKAGTTKQFALNAVTVNFEANGGFPAPEPQYLQYGTTVNAVSAMTKAGYTFHGWYSGENGAGTKYTFGAGGTPLTESNSVNVEPNSNTITLYAYWMHGTDAVSCGNPSDELTYVGTALGAECINNVLTLKNGAVGTVYGTGTVSTSSRIEIIERAIVDVALYNVEITGNGVSPFILRTSAIATVRLGGTNTFRTINAGHAGLNVPGGTTLTITSMDGDGSESGTLTAAGGAVSSSSAGAGIGGSLDQSVGNITINGGTIIANGVGYDDASSAGIGGGTSGAKFGAIGNITINGGIVTATGGQGNYSAGSGIGAATYYYESGPAGNITINGGTVGARAPGGNNCTGNVGMGGASGNVTINGGDITASSPCKAAIGVSGNISISGGMITATNNNSNSTINAGNISITGGAIAAINNNTSALAIGATSPISISGGTIIATGTGIGANSITGSPTILATAINGKTQSDRANGILIGDDVTIDATDTPIAVALNASLDVKSGAIFTIAKNVNVTVTENNPLDIKGGGILDIFGILTIPDKAMVTVGGDVFLEDGGQIIGTYKFKLSGSPVSDTEVTNVTNSSITIKKPRLLIQTEQNMAYAVTQSATPPTNPQDWTPITTSTPESIEISITNPLTSMHYIHTHSQESTANKAGTPKTLPLYPVEVNFDSQGGERTPATQNLYYTSTVATVDDPERDDYVFLGWYTDENGEGIEYTFGENGTMLTESNGVTITQNVGAITLYAYWLPGGPNFQIIECGDLVYLGTNALCESTLLTLRDEAIGTIAENTSTTRVLIEEDATVDVTLFDANINVSAGSAFTLGENSTATIKLSGRNYLTTSAASYAALNAPETTTLTIEGITADATLTAAATNTTNNNSGAGIGGNNSQAAGNITINSGIITARSASVGGNGAAAIGGGGNNQAGGKIDINGGTIVAINTGNNTSIGGTGNNSGGEINISGNGTIYAFGRGIGVSSGSGRTQTTIYGTPIILASAVNGIPSDNANGILIGNANVTFVTNQDNVTANIITSFTVPSHLTFTIPENVEVIPANNSTIQINGNVAGKINGAAVTDINFTEITSETATFEPQLLANVDQGIQYAHSSNLDTPGTWYDVSNMNQPTVINVTPQQSTPYYVFVRSQENASYKAGPYKQFKLNPVTVTFDAQDGETTPDTQYLYESSVVTEVQDPEKDDYVFVGWYACDADTIYEHGVYPRYCITYPLGTGGTKLTAANGVDTSQDTYTITLYAYWILGGAGNEAISCGDANVNDSISYVGSPGGAECIDDTLTIKNHAVGTIVGKTSSARVAVAERAIVDITLNNVEITSSTDSPFMLGTNATATVRLSGNNVLISANALYAGLNAPQGTFLTITSASGDGSENGTLSATVTDNPGGGAAGIGGNNNQSAGHITINGGTIAAKGTAPLNADYYGSRGAAGIGGGQCGIAGCSTAESITINGGNVSAYSNGLAAAIGGGFDTVFEGTGMLDGDITITGGTVFATMTTAQGGASPVIGSGNAQSGYAFRAGGNVTITGGTVIAAAPAGREAIGGGSKVQTTDSAVNIRGGTIYATGAGIGMENTSGNAETVVTVTEAPIILATSLKGYETSDANSGILIGDDVTINAAVNPITVDLNASLNVKSGAIFTIAKTVSATVKASNTLTIESGGILDIFGALTIASGATMTVNGDLFLEDGGTLTGYAENPDGSPVSDTEVTNVANSSITIKKPRLLIQTEQDMEYAVTTDSTPPQNDWTTINSQTPDLIPIGVTNPLNSMHYIHTRSKGSVNYKAGTPKTLPLYPVTVSFNTQQGSTVNNQSLYYTSTVATVTSTKNNYVFMGWYTEENGEGIEYALGANGTLLTEENGVTINNNAGTITLYAYWLLGTPGSEVIECGSLVYVGTNALCESTLLTLSDNATGTISGNTLYTRVLVAEDAEVEVTLVDANINVAAGSAFTLGQGADATIKLSGRNYLTTSAASYAALNAPETTTLTIESITPDATLTAAATNTTNNNSGAGIGGNNSQAAGRITINSGIVTARSASTGANGAAAIGGGGNNQAGGTVSITGGTVIAINTGNNTSIGGTGNSNDGTITISGGTIYAFGRGIGVSSGT